MISFAASLNAKYGTFEVEGYEFDAARVLRSVAPAAYARLQAEFVADQLAPFEEPTDTDEEIDLLEDLG